MIKRTVALLIFIALAVSCKKSKGFSEDMLIKPVDLGKYYALDKDQIKIFLPEGFKELSESEIQAFHTSIKNEDERYYYEQAYKQRKVAYGNFYDFYNAELFSEVIVNTLPYTPFDRSSASQLLYYLRKDHERYQELTGIRHSKIKATYLGQKNLQVFKAIYRLTTDNAHSNTNDDDYEMYNTVYLISSNNKTFLLNILMPFELDFDPFIKKIKL